MISNNFMYFLKKPHILAKPEIQFLNIQTVKTFLCIDTSQNYLDEILTLSIDAVTEYVENLFNVSLNRQDILLKYKFNKENSYKLIRGPQINIIKVNIFYDDQPQILNTNDYRITNDNVLIVLNNTNYTMLEIEYEAQLDSSYQFSWINSVKIIMMQHIGFILSNRQQLDIKDNQEILKIYTPLLKKEV